MFDLTKIPTYLPIYFDELVAGKSVPPPNPFCAYINEILSDEDDLLHCQTDVEWCKQLKDVTLCFLERIWDDCWLITSQIEHELQLIDLFEQVDLAHKRHMWKEIEGYIREHHSSDFNIDAYIQTLRNYKGKDDEHIEDILQALIDDWRKIAMAPTFHYIEGKIQSEAEKQNFANSIEESNRKIQLYTKIAWQDPLLKSILLEIGRDQNKEKNLNREFENFIPIVLSHPHNVEDINGVSIGNNTSLVLPTEIVFASDISTEDVFYYRYTTKQLQQFSPKPSKQNINSNKTNHVTKSSNGPIIVGIDTSGSMNGEPLAQAITMLYALVDIARKEKRACLLITFSVSAKVLDVTNPAILETFLNESDMGGTVIEDMLLTALETLKTKKYQNADVLIISDFQMDDPIPYTIKQMDEQRKKGTKFYGYLLNTSGEKYPLKWLDKKWERYID